MQDIDFDEHPEGFILEGSKPVTSAAAPVQTTEVATDKDDDFEIVEAGVESEERPNEGRGTKRKLADAAVASTSKQARVDEDDDVIELD